MALNSEYIMTLLQKYVGTDAGKRTVKEHIKHNGVSGVDASRAAALADKMCVILGERIVRVIPSFDIGAIHALAPEADRDGNMSIRIVIDEDALWRDSLEPNPSSANNAGWKNYATRNGRLGTDNIVLQFAKGWNTGGKKVSGFWHGKFIESSALQAPNDFLISAVNEFNRITPDGVTAELEEKYK